MDLTEGSVYHIETLEMELNEVHIWGFRIFFPPLGEKVNVYTRNMSSTFM